MSATDKAEIHRLECHIKALKEKLRRVETDRDNWREAWRKDRLLLEKLNQ